VQPEQAARGTHLGVPAVQELTSVYLEHTPDHRAEVLHILCACGVFAVPVDPESPDAHPLQVTGRALLHARGVLDDDGYLVAGVTVDVLIG